ncbi:MAG: helix-turn-helix domain-containing protein [Bacteroidota bacterium]
MLKEEQDSHDYGNEHAERGHNGSLHPRLAWMMCYNETRSAQEVCRRFDISRKTFYKWLKRYKQSGSDSASLSDQSRRPHRFPRATPESSVLLLKRLKEQTGFGQRRLKVYLQEKYNISLSERTIWKILKRLDQAEKEMRPVAPIGSQHNVIFSGGV